MFTGIIKELGRIRSIDRTLPIVQIEIEAKSSLINSAIGDSIALNGCCLTIIALGSDYWKAEVMEETLKRTSLDALKVGDAVNLEPALSLGDRLGGHFVQGHVDGVGVIQEKQTLADGSTLVEVTVPASLLKYIVKKGSIAIDGVSLTVVDLSQTSFSFCMIPHTEKMTNLGWKKIGERVNLEVDILAKHVEQLLSYQVSKGAT